MTTKQFFVWRCGTKGAELNVFTLETVWLRPGALIVVNFEFSVVMKNNENNYPKQFIVWQCGTE